MHFSTTTVALAVALVISTITSKVAADPISAVACVFGTNPIIFGTITFTQDSPDSPTRVYANITGLPVGDHGIHVHAYGDLSGGCETLGAHYNPTNQTHGGPDSSVHHVGDYGNIVANATSDVATLDLWSSTTMLSGPMSIIGRGIVIHSGQDDLGLGNSPLSSTTGNSGNRSACGVIGYSFV